MEMTHVTAPKRRFAGRRDAAGENRPQDFAALADALLSPRAADSPAPSATGPSDVAASPEAAPLPEPGDVPRGLYVLIPAGIDPRKRRQASLDAARRMAPASRPSAVFVFEHDRVDAHVLGEVACGRIGPQNYLGAGDMDRTIADLLGQCDSIGLAILDEPNGQLRRLGPAARRTVFLATPDAESVVETYRELKTWRRSGAQSQAALMVMGSPSPEAAGLWHRRLRRAAREFLGCDLAIQGFMASRAAAPTAALAEPLRIFSQTPAAEIWPRLLAAAGMETSATPDAVLPASPEAAPAAPPPVSAAAAAQAVEPPRAAVAAPSAPAVCPVFSIWDRAAPDELLAAIEAQAPSLLAASLRRVFRVEVDEPGAPPLAGVRTDGVLVAILVPGPGETVDTRAAQAWLATHRALLARAYPSAEIAAEGQAAAIVLAPVETPPPDGIRRFVPVRMGGHRGIVLLP